MPTTHHTPLPHDLFTLYGRQAVLEALRDNAITPYKLHLAESNQSGGSLAAILEIAESRQVPQVFHTRLALSRISRNGKQDQGVALDIRMPNLQKADVLASMASKKHWRLLALDQITNPQNVGMILRSAAAGGMDGVIIPKRGCARLDSLVIKASAGNFFRIPIYICEQLPHTLEKLSDAGMDICLMAANAKQTLFGHAPGRPVIYVLGNETDGVSRDIMRLRHTALSIPMANGTESLNVAMAATLVAYQRQWQ
jgi:23S rRNA (guanosine2251-2'-O)-methyltransferase